MKAVSNWSPTPPANHIICRECYRWKQTAEHRWDWRRTCGPDCTHTHHESEAWTDIIVDPVVELPRYLNDDNRQWVAAVALYGQPFGFTPDDVAALRDVLRDPDYNGMLVSLDISRRVIDKIAALLPPAGHGDDEAREEA